MNLPKIEKGQWILLGLLMVVSLILSANIVTRIQPASATGPVITPEQQEWLNEVQHARTIFNQAKTSYEEAGKALDSVKQNISPATCSIEKAAGRPENCPEQLFQ